VVSRRDSNGDAPPATEHGQTTDPPGQPEPAAPARVEELLEALREQHQKLETEIRHGKASLGSRESRQTAVKKQLTGLNKAAGELGKARSDADGQLAAADTALQAAKPFVEQLDDEITDFVRAGLTAIDQEIDDAATTAGQESAKLDQLTAERDQLKLDVPVKQARYDQAGATLTGLPAALKAEGAVLKAHLGDLASAVAAGQAQRGLVFYEEASRSRQRLGKLRDPAREAQYVKDLQDAENDLTDAADALAAAELTVADQQLAVTGRAADLKKLQDGRAAEVKRLESEAPAAATASTGSGG
jgi:chromosome segregation ATPase